MGKSSPGTSGRTGYSKHREQLGKGCENRASLTLGEEQGIQAGGSAKYVARRRCGYSRRGRGQSGEAGAAGERVVVALADTGIDIGV